MGISVLITTLLTKTSRVHVVKLDVLPYQIATFLKG